MKKSITCILLVVSLTLSAQEVTVGKTQGKPVQQDLFAVNLVFYFPGVAESFAKTENQKSFFYALKSGGIKTVRFPGGMPVHYYFPDSRKLTKIAKDSIELFFMNDKSRMNRKGYRDGTISHGNYLKAIPLIKACNENDIRIIYQLNTTTFVRHDTVNIIRSEKDIFYAQEGLITFLQKLKENELNIEYFEIGNEDFVYHSYIEYEKIALAFRNAIKAFFPNSKIIFTGEHFTSDLSEKLDVDFEYISFHYPYGSWPKPNENEYKTFASGIVNFDKNLSNKREKIKKRNADLKIAITETSVYNYSVRWDVKKLNHTHAHAILLASNWIDLINDQQIDVAVFHNFESTNFGLYKFGVGFDENEKAYDWYKNSAREYVYTPSVSIFKLLSDHSNRNRIAISNSEVGRITATSSESDILISVVNNSDGLKELSLDLKQWSLSGSDVLQDIYAAELGSSNPVYDSKSILLNMNNGIVKMQLEPFSFNQIKIPLKTGDE